MIMNGARSRLLAWLVVLASILAGCSPVAGVDEGTAAGAASSSATLPAAGGSVPGTQPAPPAAAPAPAAPALPQPFTANLYQEGDFVPQYTFDWCVAASIQMAHNLLDDTGGANWTAPEQQGELWEMARLRSSDSYNGANPLGWAQVLTEVGLGPYTVVSIPGYEDALQAAARAIATTGRPVGLVMWRGRHAWVMSGFESVGDPHQFPEFEVTGIYVQDPLYPHGSGQWGPSPAPNTLLTPGQLAAQFVSREPRRWSSSLPAGYVLVLPV